MLLALRPALAPSQVANYITAYGLPVAANMGRTRLTFTNSINQLLIDMNVAEPVMGWIDPAGLGHPGSTGLVLSRVCPTGMHLWVNEYGTHDIWEPDEVVDFGVLGSPVIPPSFSVAAGDDEVSISFGSDIAEFRLGTYTIAPDPAPLTAQVGFHSRSPAELGSGLSGTFTIDACRIEERDPFEGTMPWLVRLTGEFEGTLQVVHWDLSGISTHDFEGYYSIPVLVTVGEGDPVIEYLEYICDGGIPPDPAVHVGE